MKVEGEAEAEPLRRWRMMLAMQNMSSHASARKVRKAANSGRRSRAELPSRR